MSSSHPVENSQSFPNTPLLYDQEGVSKLPPRLDPSPLLPDLLTDVPSVPECILDPPSTAHHKPSPLKSQRRSSSSQSGQGKLAFMPILAPSPQLFATDSPAKKASKGKHHRRAPSLPQPATFITFTNVNPKLSRKENDVARGINNGNFIEFSEPTYGRKAPLKRRLTDAAAPKDRKQKQDEFITTTVPGPHEMPPIEDDGMKPPFSYATLIGMSILRAPNRRLTLAQIYKWISDTFSFYRNSDSCWQNSIRHNLSLNKAFVKQERPKDDPGKGNYWAIEPGMEVQFLKDKLVRRATLSTIPLPSSDLQRESLSFSQGPGTNIWRVQPPALPVSQSPANQDLSSDATLPASDPAFQEDASNEGLAVAVAAPQPQITCSSPPQIIHSSPPIAPSRFIRPRTPPTPSRPMTSAAVPRPRKRKSVMANDSGYFSSLESSVMKPTMMTHFLTSDPDFEPPQIKRGRAEEEIARIRSSSHDLSPSHSNILSGSSPFRGEHIGMLPPPLTPVIKFKKPARPPASLSPNTNLRNHRRKIQQMVNSPLKTLGLTDEDLPWSPAFNLHDETLTPNENLNSHFDIFADPVGENISTPIYGSPEKRRAKRSRTDTPVMPGDALSAINSNRRIDTPVASKKLKLGLPDSPSKFLDPGRYIDATNDDCFSFSPFDESPSEVDGIDLLQGFQKINGASQDESISRGHGFRPHLGHMNNTFL
ncbi:Fork head domain containing protein [Elaphomyces granulatus]